MKLFRLMNFLMRKHVFLILLSLLLALLTIFSNIGLLSVSSVLILKAGLHPPEVLDLMVLIVLVRFFGISRGVFRYLERVISHNTTFKILSSLREYVFKIFNENYSENNKVFKTGTIYTKLVNNVDALREYFLRVVYPLITAILTGIFTALLVSFFSTTVSIIYISFYIFSGFILPGMIYSLNRNLAKKESVLKKEVNITLLDIFNGITEIHVYGLKESFSKRYHLLQKKLYLVQIKKNILTALGNNLYSLFTALMMVVVLIITAPLVSMGKLDSIYYAMLPLSLMASFESLIPMFNLFYKYNESKIAGNNILSIIDAKVPDKKREKQNLTGSDLVVNDLCVKEKDTNHKILDKISFDLSVGKKIGIVGISGSGKSTLLKTLMGFMDYSDGDIMLDGKSYSNLNIEDIRKQITYVEQNPYLFNTTIMENLLIAHPEAIEETINHVLEKAQLQTFIKDLPEEMHTKLGQFGSKISGGEKQRLAIARALLKNSPVVLLDEPTANLDIELEQKLIDSVFDFIKDRSCIWVTHRLINLDKMDEILVFDKGKIVERGTENVLLGKKGLYYKLWNIQRQKIVK